MSPSEIDTSLNKRKKLVKTTRKQNLIQISRTRVTPWWSTGEDEGISQNTLHQVVICLTFENRCKKHSNNGCKREREQLLLHDHTQ